MLRESIELHRQGRLAEAEQGYRAQLATNPNDSEALRLLGTVRRDLGDFAESAQLFQRAHELAPEQPNLLLMLGSVRYQNGDLDAARDAYERALALDPNLAGAHTTLGHLAMMNGNPTLAEQYFRTALRVTEDAQAYSGLGMLALDREDAEGAMKYLTRAADLAPNDASIAFSMGRGFSKRGMLAFAEQSFLRALQLQPGLPHARNALGQLLLTANRADEAEPHMRALAGVRNFELAGELGLGDVFRAQGKYEEAVAQYRRGLARNPDHDGAFEALLWTLRKLGRGSEVAALLDAHIAQYPGQDRWRAERAMMLTEVGRLGEAAADWQLILERQPTSLQAAIETTRLRERNGEVEVAAELAENLANRFPGDPNLTLVRARARMRKNDDAGARAILDTLAGRPTPIDLARLALHYLGRLHDRAGETVEAARNFREAQRGLPTSLPELKTLPSDFSRLAEEPAGGRWAQAPTLLIGVPGSGVERIAALLADQPGLDVLSDRVTRPRNDGFDVRAFDHSQSDLHAEGIAALREEYQAPMRAGGIQFERPLIDWIPRWDAHQLAFVRRVMPGARIILVDRDPRDALINWLAFGWLPGAALSDLDHGVDWLARAVRHVRLGLEHGGVEHLVVNADQLLADPAGAGAELARFVGLDTLVSGAGTVRGEAGLGGLPPRFADGHWQGYAETLAEPFARVLADPYASA